MNNIQNLTGTYVFVLVNVFKSVRNMPCCKQVRTTKRASMTKKKTVYRCIQLHCGVTQLARASN